MATNRAAPATRDPGMPLSNSGRTQISNCAAPRSTAGRIQSPQRATRDRAASRPDMRATLLRSGSRDIPLGTDPHADGINHRLTRDHTRRRRRADRCRLASSSMDLEQGGSMSRFPFASLAVAGLLLIGAPGASAAGPPVIKQTTAVVNELELISEAHPCTGQ